MFAAKEVVGRQNPQRKKVLSERAKKVGDLTQLNHAEMSPSGVDVCRIMKVVGVYIEYMGVFEKIVTFCV